MDVRPMSRPRRVGYRVAQTHLPEFVDDVQLYPETDGT